MDDRQQGIRQIDFSIVAVVLVICISGVFAIRSAVHTDPSASYVNKQIFGLIVGFSAMLWLAMQEYESLLKKFAKYVYYLNLLLLIVVLARGHSSHGAARWIPLGPVQIQPSEFAKIILIGTLSLYLYDRLDTIRTWPTVIKSFIHVAIPMLLIAKQPDLGTSLVILAIWFGIMIMAGAKITHLGAFLVAGVLLFTAMWHFNILKDYQKTRLVVFINPGADPRDAGYHLNQSIIAIGAGQVSGQGYGKGVQSNGKFIPEQHTDFIFTVVGEEGGFVACVILLGFYLVLLERGVVIMAACKDPLGRLIAAGVISMLTFHSVVNSGMTMGIMPVVGVPLPFFSYGLSSLIVNMSAVGLLLSVASRKHRMMFN